MHLHRAARALGAEARRLDALDALTVDVQDADLARLAHGLDRLLRRAVVVAVDARVFEEQVRVDVALHLVDVLEVVVHAVDLAGSGASRRVRHAEPERVGVALHELGDQRALARAGAARDDERRKHSHAPNGLERGVNGWHTSRARAQRCV